MEKLCNILNTADHRAQTDKKLRLAVVTIAYMNTYVRYFSCLILFELILSALYKISD